MGIPSYFSYIIRNFPKIVKKLEANDEILHHLFLDCNSIVYDSVHKYKDTVPTDQEIIDSVLNKISDYIILVRPSKTVFIAFDGVAPFAKMKQQKKRRHKTQFVSQVFPDTQHKWDTLKITPGTDFMKNLSNQITNFFMNTEQKYGVQNMIVSTSNEPGEGEHKLFKYIRENNLVDDNVIIYGLDSDLFMLSIFNHKYYKNAYIFREAPEFLKSKIELLTKGQSNDDTFLVDIGLLRICILREMGFSDSNRIYDYVFMCFFLGNDFLPQFPAWNIRTHGITALLDVYNKIFSKKMDTYLIKYKDQTFDVCWENVDLLISYMSKLEHQFLLEEHSIREKFDKWIWNEPKTNEEHDKMFQNMPIINRAGERYICPTENGWEQRYYQLLFFDKEKSNSSEIRKICQNYLEGLKWCLIYYTDDCSDWRWSYLYKYGPLFIDLKKELKNKDCLAILNNLAITDNIKKQPMTQEEQLLYVLPSNNQNKGKVELMWHYKRYIWESE